MKFPALPGWRRSSQAARAPVATPAHRQGAQPASPAGLLPRTRRPPAQASGSGAGLAQSDPQSSRQATPVHSAATLDKLATLLARPEPAGTQTVPAGTVVTQASPSGDGWGMTFLRQAERRALFKLADDPEAAPLDMAKLLAGKPDLNVRDKDGRTALLRAAEAENTGMVKMLVDRGADVHAADAKGVTALHLAAASPEDGKAQAMLSGLLAAGADVHAQNVFGLTPLFAAASKAAVDLLLDAGSAIDHRERLGNTALTYAAMTWRPHAMLALLARGADPPASNEDGRSFIDMVRGHYGLDEDATLPHQPAALAGYIARREAEQQLALFHLADNPDAAFPEVMALLSSASDLEVRDQGGRTVLLRAAQAQNAEMVEALVDHGADVHAADANGLTALHMAAASSEDDRVRPMVSGLLATGAHVHAQNVYGKTPLFMAASRAAVDLLLDAGAAIDHRDRLGNTALIGAAMSPDWNPHAVLALLERGADPLATNSAGDSFIDMVRDHYGLGEGAALPLEPVALADYIARREVEPPRRLPTAPRVPAPALVEAPGKRINSLPSGHKISLVDRPHARIGELDPKDLDELSRALGFGPLSPAAQGGDAQCAGIFRTLDAFAQDIFGGFADHDNEVLKHPGLLSGLSAAERQELKAAMDTAHMFVAAPRDLRGRFIMPCQWTVMFGGSQNLRDLRHDILSGFGQTSSVDRAARRIGELLAKQMRRNDNQIRIERIAGASMGGASAQTMLAALQNRMLLDKQPSMLLLDPQLLNNRQAARATRDGSLAVDYRMPRGVAISLDYAKAPHRGLMGIMKGPGGYTYPGLVHLKLGLTDTDGADGKAPKPTGPPGLGYHSDFRPFGLALARFIGTATQPEAGPPEPEPSLLEVGWLPPIREFDPKVRFADAEPDAGPSRAAAQRARISGTGEGPQSAASVTVAREKEERKARQAVPARAGHAAMRTEIGMDPGQPSLAPAPAPLKGSELALVKNALGGEGLALRRMNERAARAGGVVARMGLNVPKPLEGSRLADFAALVDRDIARLAESTRIDRPFAADLLLRAVDAGQMGARLRPDDKALLREVLAKAKA